MSMASMLSHFAIDHARYVTPTGQIIFDGVTKTTTGYAHATLGAVTQVTRHGFHGGEDPVDAGDEPWWVDDHKIVRHIVAMKSAFPGFEYHRADDDKAPCWVGPIDTGRGTFTVGIFLRRDERLPFVRVLSRQLLGMNRNGSFIKSPHLYVNGDLCVAAQDDWDPTQHTAATVTAWAAHWLAAFTEWRITTRWPIEGAEVAA